LGVYLHSIEVNTLSVGSNPRWRQSAQSDHLGQNVSDPDSRPYCRVQPTHTLDTSIDETSSAASCTTTIEKPLDYPSGWGFNPTGKGKGSQVSQIMDA
jgi:hypothetical protein